MQITKEKVVEIHYTLKNNDGKIIDSSEGQAPLMFLQGFGNIIPGLEKALEGKQKGDKVDVVIPPEEAYGVRQIDLIQKAPLSAFEDSSQIKVGAQFQMYGEHGPVIATVTAVDVDGAILDLNHPLAGETLHFNVSVETVRDALPEELAHGHAHGPDGHHH